jgi:SNW domain-containing protein 1
MNSHLPAPKHQYVIHSDVSSSANSNSNSNSNSNRSKAIPSYPNRGGKNSKFVPINSDDFGDGGAYPEINVVQYPLGMGKPGNKSSNALVSVDVNDKGEVQYDAIVKRGNGNKIVHTTLNDIKEKPGDLVLLRLPSKEEEEKDTDRTKKALEAILLSKISSSNPTTVAAHNSSSEYIRYTPNPNAPGYTAQQRVIKIVPAQIDPLEPPKHTLKKLPKGPGSPPAPVLHSPPRKLTVAEQQAFKIPPSISNYKNVKGYVIPLDQRLAADGRGLQEVTINDKFASVNEALYIAERKAAEDLKIRQQIRQKLAMKEKVINFLLLSSLCPSF